MIVKLDNKTSDGKQIYRFDCVVDSRRRQEPVVPTQQETETQEKTIEAENEATDAAPAVDLPSSSGMVRDGWRLISAVEAWPSSSFHLPQCVDYSHNDGAAIRGAIDIINAKRPDLTWNHSTDARDVAGHVESAYWEQSADIPPGVNAQLVVNPEYDIKAAQGLAHKVLRNGSIGFSMDVIPSHEDMKFEAFAERQGEVVNGEKVRWLPVAVHDVLHMAMLPAGTGADPNAGRRSLGNMSANNTNTNTHRRINMHELAIKLLSQTCEGLGIDVVLEADENSAIPEGLEERLSNKVASLSGIQKKYNELAASVEMVMNAAKAAGLDVETVQDLRDKLDSVYVLAKEGEKVISVKREDALNWFDKAKSDPAKAEMGETTKRIRARIEQSEDLDFLNDMICEYQEMAEARFGNQNRSSVIEELPVEKTVKNGKGNKDIVDSSTRIFS